MSRNSSTSVSRIARQVQQPILRNSRLFSTSARLRQTAIEEALLGESSKSSDIANKTVPSTPTFRKPSSSSVTSFRNSRPHSAPYRLHAHCAKHNTILSFTRSLPRNSEDLSSRDIVQRAEAGTLSYGSTSINPKIYGQTVLRSSCGIVGFKKAQRGTFEAATRASNRMFEMIEKLGRTERKTKHGNKILDPAPTEIELVFKGFGQGREAVFAALQTDAGTHVRNLVKKITDATPIKIGGTRPRKRRNVGYSDPNRYLRL